MAIKILIEKSKNSKHLIQLYEFWVFENEYCILTMELGEGTIEEYLKANTIKNE